jgi:Glycosyltransferase family 87
MGDGLPSRGGSGPAPGVTRKRWRYDGVGWPRSRQEIRPGIPAVVVVVAATIWGYVSIGPNGRIDAGRVEAHRTDFTVFTEAGSAFFDGRDPYRVSNPRGWHYLYPPIFALIVSPLSALDTQSQVVAWYVINLVLTLGCVVEARRLWVLSATLASPLGGWLGICGGAAVVLPFLDCMQAGQLGIAILYLLMVGFRLAVLGRSGRSWFLGGLILALPAAIKLVPALPVLFLVFQRWSAVVLARRGGRPGRSASTLTAGVLAGASLFLLAIPASLVGWSKNLDYLHVWYNRVVVNERVGPNANFNIHSYRNQSLANAYYLWSRATGHQVTRDSRAAAPRDRAERVVHPSVRVVIGVDLALLMIVGLVLGSRDDHLDQATAYGLACGVTLLASPLSWCHYFMVQLPALLCMPAWLTRRGMTTLGRVFALVPAAMSWAHYLVPPIAELGLLGLVTTAWFSTAIGLVLGVVLSHALAKTPSTPSGDPGPRDRVHAIPPPHFRDRAADVPVAARVARLRSGVRKDRGPD